MHDEDEKNYPRYYNGLMSILNLHEVTKLKRIDEKGMVDATTRKIYIPNPSATAMGILALRSSYEQIPVIKRLLYKYINFEASLALRATEGEEFILEFHMPCLVWQRWDISSWSAICLADSYFADETDPDDPVMLAHYVKDTDSDDPGLDPLSTGKLTADKVAPTDPREYFLVVVRYRVMRLLETWTNVEFQLGEKIHQYLDAPHLLFRQDSTNLGTADRDTAAVEGGEAWLKKTRRLLNRLLKMLRTSLNAFDKFHERDTVRIDAQAKRPTSLHMRDSFHKINTYVDDLKNIFEGLTNLNSEIDTFESDLVNYMAVENVRAIKLQHLNVTILQVFSPMALAGSVMQAGLVAGNVVIWFVFLTVVFTGLTLSLKPAIKWYEDRKVHHRQPSLTPAATESEAGVLDGRTGTGFSISSYSTFLRERLARKPTESLPT
ncbi:hypothetical protein CGCF413_v003407 [Colletotrichum fructicola]|nr:hypothetical protein CGCF413_v003407 [Colletotrichum fructicola]